MKRKPTEAEKYCAGVGNGDNLFEVCRAINVAEMRRQGDNDLADAIKTFRDSLRKMRRLAQLHTTKY